MKKEFRETLKLLKTLPENSRIIFLDIDDNKNPEELFDKIKKIHNLKGTVIISRKEEV